MIVRNRNEWDAEYKKCLTSSYYFATNYIQLKMADGTVVPFTTGLSEKEFNEITDRIHTLEGEVVVLQSKKAIL